MDLLINIIELALLLVFGFTVTTFTIALYEWANSIGRPIRQILGMANLWLALRLIISEYLALIITLLLYPFGFLNLPEGQTPEGKKPVILLHGLFLNRACWFAMKLRFRLHGISDLHTLNLSPLKDVESVTEIVARKVDSLRHERGIEKVNIIGHSMGAIVARNYTQIRGGARKVEKCILIGAPNQGSKLAPFALTTLGETLLPASDFLSNLNKQGFPQTVDYLNIYSRHDNMVIPATSSSLTDIRNIELTGLGHNSLLYNGKTFREVIIFLNSADHENAQDQQPQEG